MTASVFLALALLFIPAVCASAEQVTEMKLAVVILDSFSSCIVGDPGNASMQCCGLVNTTDGQTSYAYRDNYNYRGLRPDDPNLEEYGNAVCITPSIGKGSSDSIREKISKIADELRTNSAGTLLIKPYYIEYPQVEATENGLSLSRWMNGLYPSPEDLGESIKEEIDDDTDYVLVIYGLDDQNQNLSIGSPGCSAMKGELKGAIYATVSLASDGTGCSVFSAFAEELYYAAKEVTKLPAAFPEEYPKSMCGTYTKSTYDWFPDPAKRSMDPDYEACQNHYGDWTGYCSSILPKDCEEEYLKHLIKNHYVPGTKITGNHCANNASDFGETGTDCGGTCVPCLGQPRQLLRQLLPHRQQLPPQQS